MSNLNNETILTIEEIITLGEQARAIEPGENGYILPITFARAIEQAVLQTPEIQALRKDAKRYRTLRKQEIMVSMTYGGNTGASPWISSNELDSCADSLASSMEKQP